MSFWSKPQVILVWKQQDSGATRKESIELLTEETRAEVLARILLFVAPEGMILWEATYKTSHGKWDVVAEGKWREPR